MNFSHEQEEVEILATTIKAIIEAMPLDLMDTTNQENLALLTVDAAEVTEEHSIGPN